VEVRNDSVRVYFQFNGAKCREHVGPNTPDTIAYAQRLAELIRHEIRAGTFDYSRHFPSSSHLKENTLGHYLYLWLEIKSGQVAPSTYRSYAAYAENWIRPQWGHRQAHHIDYIDIETWIRSSMRGLTNKTIREIIAILRQVFALYRTRNQSAHDPTAGVKIRLPDSEDPDPFTREEIRLITTTDTEMIQERNLVQFMIWSGARVSEAMALAWEDVDLQKGTALFLRAVVRQGYKVTKTRRSTRRVDLLGPARAALEAQIKLTTKLRIRVVDVVDRDNRTIRQQRVRFVFHNSYSNQPFTNEKRLRDKFFATHLQAAEVRYRPPSQCRHTYISQMLTANMPIDWIVHQVGHTTAEMIRRRYGKWISEERPDMVKLAEERLGL